MQRIARIGTHSVMFTWHLGLTGAAKGFRYPSLQIMYYFPFLQHKAIGPHDYFLPSWPPFHFKTNFRYLNAIYSFFQTCCFLLERHRLLDLHGGQMIHSQTEGTSFDKSCMPRFLLKWGRKSHAVFCCWICHCCHLLTWNMLAIDAICHLSCRSAISMHCLGF